LRFTKGQSSIQSARRLVRKVSFLPVWLILFKLEGFGPATCPLASRHRLLGLRINYALRPSSHIHISQFRCSSELMIKEKNREKSQFGKKSAKVFQLQQCNCRWHCEPVSVAHSRLGNCTRLKRENGVSSRGLTGLAACPLLAVSGSPGGRTACPLLVVSGSPGGRTACPLLAVSGSTGGRTAT
jgi:hypothetical protein